MLNDYLKKELENKVQEKMQNLSQQEILQYAKKERFFRFFLTSFVSIFILIASVVLLYIGISVRNIIVIIIGVILFIIFVIFFILCNRKKANEELASIAIKRELQVVVRNSLMEERIKENLPDSEFTISKTIQIIDNGRYSNNLLIDNINKKFIYQMGRQYSKAYAFSDIISYEIYENGKSRVQGRAGSAIIGGAFFGLGGAIVGSSRSRNIDEKCNQLKLIININDFNCPQILIKYVDGLNLDKSGITYKKLRENLQMVCSQLEYMLNVKPLKQEFTNEQSDKMEIAKTNIEQLKELKEMLNQELITQEDFDCKKKEILGL